MSTRRPTPRPRRGHSPVRLYHEHDQDRAAPTAGATSTPSSKRTATSTSARTGATSPPPRARPLYPHITVQVTGEDGKAFAIIGRTRRALERGGATREDLGAFLEEATSCDYDHLLATVMRWVEVA